MQQAKNALHVTVMTVLENAETERLLNADPANVPGSQIHGGGLAHSHHIMLFLNIQATEHLKKLALKMIIGIGS